MLVVNAKNRKETGKGFSRRLRLKNKFPGVLYGIKKSPILLELDHHSIFNLQKNIEFYKKKLCLIVDNQKYIVRLQAIQKHSFKLKILHIDFLYI